MGYSEAVLDFREAGATGGAARPPSIIGTSTAMRRLLATVARVAPKDVTVLVRGETGTGKELVASLVHVQSSRSRGPLVRFNCAAIPGELAEAELFGHTQGAFTGAIHARGGYFVQADGGTLVLDEVGELPLPIQAKLLRALQGGEIQPVGANRDLTADVRAGRFREDLYYRLAVVELLVPPLRDHREDIPGLAEEFVRRYGKRFGNGEVRLSRALVEALCHACWPGNVRQLENAVARMVALGSAGEIGLDAFADTASALTETERRMEPVSERTLPEQIEALERSVIARTMDAVAGNRSEAARRLGLSRGTLVLDEVGELPLPIQAKLLRALQGGEIQPVGGTLGAKDAQDGFPVRTGVFLERPL